MNDVAGRIAALSADQRAALVRRLRQDGPAGVSGDPWIVRSGAGADAGRRLFCLSYAGGGASTFRTWAEHLPPEVEVCAVQLPGRESRLAEPAHRRVGPLVAALGEALAPYLDRPFALFGHSMGALVAFELARHLRRTSAPPPSRLLLAAFRAPDRPNPNIRIHHLPDEVFKVVLRSEGVPAPVLRSEELMAAMLPTLRADFELCDSYEYAAEAPLDCPFSVFGGDQDVRVGAADLDGWCAHTTADSRLSMLPGSHFFVHGARDQLLAGIRHDLERDTSPSQGAHHV